MNINQQPLTQVITPTTKHLQRSCQVFILKKAAPWSTQVSTLETRLAFEENFREFFSKPRPIIQYVTTFDRYAILASSEGKNELKTLVSNSDVSGISISSQVNGTSTATIELRNPLLKYTFKEHPVKRGRYLLESNDEIIIRLPGLDDKLYTTFQGYINTVTPINTGEEHKIILECEDLTKRLRESRTNIRPSLNQGEAEVNASANTIPYANDKPHYVITKALVRAYSNFYSVSGFDEELEKAESSGNALAVQDLYDKYTNYFIQEYPEGEIPPQYIYVYKTSLANHTATAQYLGITLEEFQKMDLIGVVSGTQQKAYQVSFMKSNWDFWISEWKPVLQICKEIANSIEFEFFCNPEGVIYFRPLNILLPAEVNDQANLTTPRVKKEYWLQDINIIEKSLHDTDDGILTIGIVQGNPVWGDLGPFDWLRSTYKDRVLGRKYGPRVSQIISRIDLKDPESCRIYARAWLSRNNRKSRAGNVTMIGDARIRVGNPCYLEQENVIYYIDRVSHSFVAGQSYKMTLSLTYGRYPLGLTEDKAKELMARKTTTPAEDAVIYSAAINQVLVDRGPGGTGEFVQEEVDRIRGNMYQFLTFNGYVWEDLTDLDYTQIVSEASIIKEILGLKEMYEDKALENLATRLNGMVVASSVKKE